LNTVTLIYRNMVSIMSYANSTRFSNYEPGDEPEMGLQEVQGLSIDSLIDELDETFPEESPSRTESIEELMWRGGQRNVVNWIKRRIEDG